MRLAAVGDIHGHENLAAVAADLDRLGPVDLFLLAGDTTNRNDLEAFGKVLETIRSRIPAPIAAVFGNNEYANDHPTYVTRFAATHRIRCWQDAFSEAMTPLPIHNVAYPVRHAVATFDL